MSPQPVPKNGKHTICLIPTTLRIKRRIKRLSVSLKDGDFPNKKTYSEFVLELLKHYKEKTTFNLVKQTGFKIHSIKIDEEHNQIYGIAKAGGFGIRSDLLNIKNTDEVKNRNETDCELMQFFYLFEFRPGRDAAILVLSTFGSYAVRPAFMHCLIDYFRDSPFRADMNTVVDMDYIKKHATEKIKAVKYFWREVPEDKADNLDVDNPSLYKEGRMDVIIRPKKGKFFSFSGWDAATTRLKKGFTVNEMKSEDVKLEVELDGKKKTVNFEDLSCFKTTFDVTERLIFEDGYPTLKSLLVECREILSMPRKALDWK